jgi:hypothetical protein
VLQIETPHIRVPDEIQIQPHPLRPMPPQPQNPRLPPTLAAGQALDLDQDERADHDGQGPPTASPLVILDLRVQLGPRPHAHRSVTGVLARALGGRLWPGAQIVALHLRTVATGASYVRGRIAEARVAVEATPRPQADEDLARTTPLQPPLQLDEVVARIEDEYSNGRSFFESIQQYLHLPGGDHVGVLGGPDALDIHRGGPTLAGEVQPGDELVDPACATMGWPEEWRDG